MSRTGAEIDNDPFRQARDLLGTSSIGEDIRCALREDVKLAARSREVEAMARMEGLDLPDSELMKRAWRS